MRPQHILLAMFVTLLWGFNFVVIRVGLDNFPPLFLLALRFMLVALPLVFLLPRPKVSWRLILAFGLVFGTAKFGLLFLGMNRGISPGLASLVLQSQAFFTLLLLAVVFQQYPSKWQLAGVVIAFVGIGVIASTVGGDITFMGLALTVMAGLMWGIGNLLLKQAGQVDMLSFMIWTSLVPPLPLFLLSYWFEGPARMSESLANITWLGAGAIAYITIVATIFGFTIWGKLIGQYGAGRVAPFSLLVPVFGMISSALFLGESFGSTRLIAAALVIMGLVLANMKSARAPLGK